jgi:hypothetical protein
MLEPGDIIDPQFLPAAALNLITIDNSLIPGLDPGLPWISASGYEQTRPVVGDNQIVFYYWMSYETTNNGLYLNIPTAIHDDQGKWYNIAGVSLVAHDGDSSHHPFPLQYNFHSNPSIGSPAAAPGTYFVTGFVSYIRQNY